MKYLAWIAIAVVVLSVGAGFFLIGSPAKERMRQFDQRRINDLQSIQGMVLWYWQSKGHLPEKLSDTHDDLQGNVLPLDPEKGTEYEYRVKGDTNFELCAVFGLPGDSHYPYYPQPMMTRPMPPMGYPSKAGFGNEIFKHEAGRTCFQRTIDPELYKPQK